jgi:hypothetical protein
MGLFLGTDINKGQCITTMLRPVYFQFSKFKDRFGHMDQLVDSVCHARGIPHDSGVVVRGGYLWDAAFDVRDENGLPIPPPWWRMNHHTSPDITNVRAVSERGKNGEIVQLKWTARRDIAAGEELFFDYGEAPASWSSEASINAIKESMKVRAANPEKWKPTSMQNIPSCRLATHAIVSGVEMYLLDVPDSVKAEPPVSEASFPTKAFVLRNWSENPSMSLRTARSQHARERTRGPSGLPRAPSVVARAAEPGRGAPGPRYPRDATRRRTGYQRRKA